MSLASFDTKDEARAWARQRRQALAQVEGTRLGDAITDRLLTLPAYREAATVLTYIGSMPGELDTRPLIEAALASGKRVLVPITLPLGRMAWSCLERIEDLVRSRRGILEPPPSLRRLVAPSAELCVVPGLCFSRVGHRIGFGAGYYDRFLDQFDGESVGLSPEALFGVEFPAEPHDRRVHSVITEQGIHGVRDGVTFG